MGRAERLRQRADHIYSRYGRRFWIAHSVWALFTGVVVLVLAHEQYGYVPWVVAFLGLTWLSTLFFARLSGRLPESWWTKVGRGFVSYLSRVMYQETLFFLIPFYAYSVSLPSWNALFVVVLAVLAVLACLDLVFDDLLRGSRAFALFYFFFVAFAALNFLLPLLFRIDLEVAGPVAALVAAASALPLAYRPSQAPRGRRWLGAVGVLLLAAGIAWAARPLVPPVPLRLQNLVFAAAVIEESGKPEEPLGSVVRPAQLDAGRLYVVARVFSPLPLPAQVVLEWSRDGEPVRTSRAVDVLAHSLGFRVWDAIGGAEEGGLPPGRYTVEVRTAGGRLFGRGSLQVEG